MAGVLAAVVRPERDVGGFQSPVHDAGQVGLHGAQVDGVLQPGGERFYGAVGVVAGAVEPPVDDALDLAPDRVEQGGGGQGGSRDCYRGFDGEYLGGQQDQAGVHPDQQPGHDRVGQRAGDDPVDVVQAVAQDGHAQARGQHGYGDRGYGVEDSLRGG